MAIAINILFWIASALIGLYAILILFYRQKFIQLQYFTIDENILPANKFTVIIPARDEEENIGKCLEGIFQQSYPAELIEIIVIDDHSIDNTAGIIKELQKDHPNLHLIRLAEILEGQQINSYKKKAIEIAIRQSTGDWIVTTDADCILPKQWLQNYDAYIQRNKAVFVAAPVMFINTGSAVSVFQCLDFISLQGITGASVSAGFHSMCNGANMAYNKQVFFEVDGFKGIDKIASGDDMLLMHKIKNVYPEKIGYLFTPDAIVRTLPMPTWKTFFNQRIRWASKTGNYNDKTITTVLVMVYLVNLLLLLLPVSFFFYFSYFYHWLVLFVVKTLVEIFFMIPVAKFFGQQKLIKWFPVAEPFHIIYTVVAGWLGIFGKYQWKGRVVK